MRRFHPFYFSAMISLCMLTSLNATDQKPWLAEPLAFQCNSELLYQHYDHIAKGNHLEKSLNSDWFLDISLGNSIPYFGLELEMKLANTRYQAGDVDQLKATGRYVWLDDVGGDALTLTSGVSLVKAFWPSLKDISSFHHGLGECELFLSCGKEIALKEEWIARSWGVVGLGFAERGSAWLRFDLATEARLKCFHVFRLYANSLWGLGHKKLRKNHFHGYGPIQHQSVDLGLRYCYEREMDWHMAVDYAYRVYQINFPANTQQIKISYLYSFGL